MIAPAAIEGTSILKCTLPENRMSDMLQVYFDNVNLESTQDLTFDDRNIQNRCRQIQCSSGRKPNISIS